MVATGEHAKLSRSKLILITGTAFVLITFLLYLFVRPLSEGVRIAILIGLVIVLPRVVEQVLLAKYRRQINILYPKPEKGSDPHDIITWQNNRYDKVSKDFGFGKYFLIAQVRIIMLLIWAFILFR